MGTTNCKFLETTPCGLSVILVKFDYYRSGASPKMKQSGKHETFRGICFESLKTDSKLFQMVKIYPSMSWRIVGNVCKLIGHNLENTEFLTEFQIISSKVPFTLSTPQLLFQMAIALVCVNLRNIGATLYQK